jgi:hypothetical protein
MLPVLVANVDLDARQQLAENQGFVCYQLYRAANLVERAVRGLFYA